MKEISCDIKVMLKSLALASLGLLLLTATSVFASASSRPLRIAVIDTGIDRNHKDLKNIIASNPRERINGQENNKLDDDGNGFVDDAYGWNFAENNANTLDQDGHGTHVAGIIQKICANANFSRLEIIPIKYYSKGTPKKRLVQNLNRAFEYALKMKVDIINISGGGRLGNVHERAILERAQKMGVTVVAAAGNKRPTSKDHAFFPAAYNFSNVLSVVATDWTGNILKTSNLNIQKNNYYIPGKSIYSTLPGNTYGRLTGSSQAAAVLTGIIASQYLEKKYLKEQERLHVSLNVSPYILTNKQILLTKR